MSVYEDFERDLFFEQYMGHIFDLYNLKKSGVDLTKLKTKFVSYAKQNIFERLFGITKPIINELSVVSYLDWCLIGEIENYREFKKEERFYKFFAGEKN